MSVLRVCLGTAPCSPCGKGGKPRGYFSSNRLKRVGTVLPLKKSAGGTYVLLRRLLVLGGSLILSACAVHQAPLQEIDDASSEAIQVAWMEREPALAAIDAWRVRGKIAVRAGNKGGHASLRWDRDQAIQHIELAGPIGGGRVVIDADAEGARLQDTRGGDLSGDSVAELVQQRLGWPLPFDQLPDWLRGLPSGEDARIEWDEAGRIARMNDQGWQLSYPAYQPVVLGGNSYELPRQVELNALPGTLKVYDKDGNYLGEDFFVRLIVKSWLP